MEAVSNKLLSTGIAFVISMLAMNGQGITEVRIFAQADTTAIQYFTVADIAELEGSFTFDLSGLGRGIRKLFIEVKDENGWSHYDYLNLQVVGGQGMTELNSFEYFFDEDPGFGNGIQVGMVGGVFDGEIEFDVSGLPRGVHKLYLRVNDGSGQWSWYDYQVIHVVGGNNYTFLESAEYFYDVDPGFGNGIPLDFDQTASIDSDFEIDVPAELELGEHWLYIRVEDGAGQWSHYASQLVTVCLIEIPQIATFGELCEGEMLLSVDDNYLGYLWSTGSDSSSTVVTEPGIYSVTCSDEDCSASTETEVFYNDLPIPEITQDGNTLYVSPEGFDYLWYLNGELLEGEEENVLEASESGTYSVLITQGPCASEAAAVEFTYTGIEGIAATIGIFPNPARDEVFLSAVGMNGRPWELFDLAGKRLMNGNWMGDRFSLEVRHLTPGVYLLATGNLTYRLEVIR